MKISHGDFQMNTEGPITIDQEIDRAQSRLDGYDLALERLSVTKANAYTIQTIKARRQTMKAELQRLKIKRNDLIRRGQLP